MPANPNFGTGYVDWGNYVNANQPAINASRQKVADYMGGMDTRARNTPDWLAAQQPGNWGTLTEELNTNQQALATPGGFEQVLAKANAAYDPFSKDAQGNPSKVPQAAFDPFSTALEGQDTQGLYNQAGTVKPMATTAAPTVTTPKTYGPPNVPGVTNAVPQKTGPVGKPNENPENPWKPWINNNKKYSQGAP